MNSPTSTARPIIIALVVVLLLGLIFSCLRRRRMLLLQQQQLLQNQATELSADNLQSVYVYHYPPPPGNPLALPPQAVGSPAATGYGYYTPPASAPPRLSGTYNAGYPPMSPAGGAQYIPAQDGSAGLAGAQNTTSTTTTTTVIVPAGDQDNTAPPPPYSPTVPK
ncbi:hypothetical protein EMPS_05634 [Entomortierella parvispora]|uniref:Uncharacterized protein n=1 Tax=Entomortierella parvispora TaxID=205924 RepID=A0A9P3HB00_9FUNG|nr:hypothetical protein EMPS_05634 [Entomortierella parvispora]